MSEPANDPVEWLHAQIEACVERHLVDAGVWRPRTSDGVVAFRCATVAPDRWRVWGQIHSIDQERHTFCLVLVVDTTAPDGLRSTLYFEPIGWCDGRPYRERDARNLHDIVDDPADVAWEYVVGAEIESRDDRLA